MKTMTTTKTIILTLIFLLSSALHAQDADALYDAGKQLYDAKKYSLAVKKLLPAAKQGHRKAQYRMGRCYDKGYGVAEDNGKAFYWYGKSAAQNYAKAQYHLGRCYYKGKGVGRNYAKAVELFRKAADKDNGDGQLALGKCYMKGRGVTKDAAKAKELFLKAVNNEKDGAEIKRELREEAAQGDADAQSILKMCGLK